MTRIIMVRHGETEWNKQMRIQGGQSDIPLNDTGRSQAETVRRVLEGTELAAIYASPMARALETARIINENRNLEITTMPELVEINAGIYEGIPVAELGRRFSQIVTELGENDELPRAPGGESVAEVQERGWKAIEIMARDHYGQNILVVTHYFVILTAVCKVLDLPLAGVSRFWMANGSITTVNLDGSVPRLELFNSFSLNI